MTDPEGASSSRTSLGLDPNLAATLAYLAWWVTGVLVFLLEREHRDVRFHAMQAIVGLGGLWALGLLFWILAFVLVFATGVGFHVMMALAQATWLAGVVAWMVCLYKAFTGERWKLPVVGDLAERIVERRKKAASASAHPGDE